jgi:hypothetical protein
MQEPIQSRPPASKASLIIRKLLPSLRGQRQGDEMSRRRRIKLLQSQRQPNQAPNRPRQRTPLPRPRHRRRRLRLRKGPHLSTPRVNPQPPLQPVRFMHRKRQGPGPTPPGALKRTRGGVGAAASPVQIPQTDIGPRSFLSRPPASRILPVYGLQSHRGNGARASLFPSPPIRFP